MPRPSSILNEAAFVTCITYLDTLLEGCRSDVERPGGGVPVKFS